MQYLPYQEKHYPNRAGPIRGSIFHIKRAQGKISAVKKRKMLLLIEARASKYYWSSIKLLAKQPNDWKRIYPHATDPLNQALNIGYTMLANMIRSSIKKHHLEPSIGILHAPRDRKEALVYDLEELFRGPVIDAAILPLFTRRKNWQEIESKEIVGAVLDRAEKIELKKLIGREMINYLRSVNADEIYIPEKISWAHKKKSTS